MKTLKYIGLALAITTLASCSNDEDIINTSWQNDANAVYVNTTVGGVFTRSNPASESTEEQKKFNTGDVISISTDEGLTADYKLTETGWTPTTTGRYLTWNKATMTFTAAYGANRYDRSGCYTICTDQSSPEKIAAADMMIAETSYASIPEDKKLSLYFMRQTCRVVVNIVGFTEQFSENATITSLEVKSIKLYHETYPRDEYTSINPYIQTANGTESGKAGTKYYALVTPNNNTDYDFITLTVKDGDTEKTFTVKNPVALQMGHSYQYNLTIGATPIKAANVKVSDWSNQATVPEGEAIFPSVDLSTLTAPYEITGDGTYCFSGLGNYGIKVTGGSPKIYLKDATISINSAHGIEITGGTPTIYVQGMNKIESKIQYPEATSEGAGIAGIYVAEGCTVNIKGYGRENMLTAIGGYGGSGIGGYTLEANEGTNCGNINISNVTVCAYGSRNHAGDKSAGIGGTSNGSCGTITIDNATVHAYGVEITESYDHYGTSAIGCGFPMCLSPTSIPTVIISNKSEIHAYRSNSYADYIGWAGDKDGTTSANSSINCGDKGSVTNSTIYCYTGKSATTPDKTVTYDESGNGTDK